MSENNMITPSRGTATKPYITCSTTPNATPQGTNYTVSTVSTTTGNNNTNYTTTGDNNAVKNVSNSTVNTGTTIHFSNDDEDPPLQRLAEKIARHSDIVKKAIHMFKTAMENETNHVNTKQSALDKLVRNPGYLAQSTRIEFHLYIPDEVCPLLTNNFEKQQEECDALVNRIRNDLNEKVKAHLRLCIKNLTHLRVSKLLKFLGKLIQLHLLAAIFTANSPSKLLDAETATEKTLYYAIHKLLPRLQDPYIQYLMGEPNATPEQISNYRSETITPLFETMFGAGKSADEPSDSDKILITACNDTVMEYLSFATMDHSNYITKQRRQAELKAKIEAASESLLRRIQQQSKSPGQKRQNSVQLMEANRKHQLESDDNSDDEPSKKKPKQVTFGKKLFNRNNAKKKQPPTATYSGDGNKNKGHQGRNHKKINNNNKPPQHNNNNTPHRQTQRNNNNPSRGGTLQGTRRTRWSRRSNQRWKKKQLLLDDACSNCLY